MTLLITGATSFIGARLIDQLIQKNHHIIAVVRSDSNKTVQLPNSALITTVCLNMCNYHNLHSVIDKPIDCVFHLAWNGTRGSQRDDLDIQHQNYIDSIDLINACIKAGVKKIFLAGSQAEYGHCEGIITEQTPCHPVTRYGIEKLKLFEQAIKICKKNNVTLIEPRFFSLYGESDYEKTMVISMLKKMLKDLPCELTKGIQLWDFLHIDDAVNALISLMDKMVMSGAYNIGSGDTRQLMCFVKEMRTCANSNSELHFGAVDYPKTGMVSIAPDINKLKTSVCFKPLISFNQGIKRVINSLKDEEYE